jgi:very-short-patch-repair endonuclease/predicted transcriptional regulator of viral defense system
VDKLIAQIAESQYGVISLDQLRTAGLAIGAINSRVRAGRLYRLHTGVFAVGYRRLSREGHWMAAVLALGDGAVLSHVSAAALWGLRPTSAAATHVTVRTIGGRKKRGRIVVHRSRTFAPSDVTHHNAIPVTSVARTLLDIAPMLAPGRLERAVERSLALRSFDLLAVEAALDANPRRPGAAALANIVATIQDEPPLTRSELEALMRDLCDAHDLSRPAVNMIVEGSEVDFFWRAERLIVETDGHETHGTRAAFERDRAKDARLTALGYRVVRFTYRQLVYERPLVVATLRALLAPSSA